MGESDGQRSDTDVMAHWYRVDVAFGAQQFFWCSASAHSANVE